MENTNNSKNILWVDIAKFIAMFLVIFEHVILAFKLNDTSYIAYFRNVVITFHMPLFFLLSGYLYKQKSRNENYEKILWALVVPYFLYQFLYLPFKLGYYNLYEHIPLNIASIKCFVGILLGDNLGTEGSKYALSVCPALWFVMVMIQLRFIFAHVNMTVINLSLIVISSFLVLKALQIANIDLYFCLDNTLYAIPYFVAGYYFKNYFNKKLEFLKHYKFILFIALIGLLQCCCILYHTYNSLSLHYACGFVGTFAVITFSQLFSNANKFVNVIAKNTLFIIFFHCLLLFITKWIKLYDITTLLPKTYELFAFVILYSIIIYVINYFVILLIQKLQLDVLLGKYKPRRQI